ncbi:MAG: hypothetical protein ACE5KS_07520, partial [Woeseiaceae bacterium]
MWRTSSCRDREILAKRMGQFGIGQGVRRVEDLRLLTGEGRYTDDIHVPGEVWAYFVRSPYAHARIRSIDTGAARTAPGILAVYTGEDLRFITAWPNPQNPEKGVVMYAAQRAQDVVGINAVFHGPTD